MEETREAREAREARERCNHLVKTRCCVVSLESRAEPRRRLQLQQLHSVAVGAGAGTAADSVRLDLARTILSVSRSCFPARIKTCFFLLFFFFLLLIVHFSKWHICLTVLVESRRGNRCVVCYHDRKCVAIEYLNILGSDCKKHVCKTFFR